MLLAAAAASAVRVAMAAESLATFVYSAHAAGPNPSRLPSSVARASDSLLEKKKRAADGVLTLVSV